MADPPIDTRSARVLLVDADGGRRTVLAAALGKLGYGAVIEACDVVSAGALADERAPDLVILDLDANVTGRPTVGEIRTALGLASDLPILGLTSDATPEGRARAAGVGVQDVAVYPIDPVELRLRADNALVDLRLRRLLAERSAALTDALRARTAELETVHESLSALAAMADYHDDDTGHHARRVGDLAAAIARRLELPQVSVEMLRAAAPLHDIGKVATSRRILLKQSSLTPSERLHMQHHVDVGAEILSGSRAPVLVLAAEIARTHHERFDGSGYSAGLRGEEIPLSGRIVAVADVWDTLTHDRPYRPAWEPGEALLEIERQAGAHFDPRVVEAFCALDHLTTARASRAA